MMQRAIFGLEHWSDLPETDRRIVMRDLLRRLLTGTLGVAVNAIGQFFKKIRR